MLGVLAKPTAGRLLLNGADVWALPEKERSIFRSRHIGFVFQFQSLLPDLTAVDNVAVPALLGCTMTAGAAYAKASALLHCVGLADRAGAYPWSMSGGEQRRNAIARALINSPRLLVADEPTSDLDEDTEADIIDLLKQLQQSEGFSFVLVTHNLDIARHAGQTFEMRNGVLFAAGLPPRSMEAEPHVRSFGPAKVNTQPIGPGLARPWESIRLGAEFWGGARNFLLGGSAILAAFFLLADLAVAKYQEAQLRDRGARLARLAELALSRLQADIQSVADLGEGRYELAASLLNVNGEAPVYVMPPDMHAYVQIGKIWQEVPLERTAATQAAYQRSRANAPTATASRHT
jgi:ABC-type lipoprotein export system ATPase subunit